MPQDGRFRYFHNVYLGYSEVELVSCHRIGGINAFYKVYCRIYLSRNGFMPQDGRFRYFYKVYCRI